VHAEPLDNFVTQELELQYLLEPHELAAVAAQAPLPSHTGPIADVRSAEHDWSAALAHVVVSPGKKHLVSEPPLQ